MASGHSGESRQGLDLLFVHDEEVDVVEQPADLPGGGRGVEDDECPAAPRDAAACRTSAVGISNCRTKTSPAWTAASPASTSGGGKSGFAAGLTMIWFSPWSSTAMIAVPVAAVRADPHVAGVDAGPGQDLKNPPAMGVVADGAGEVHRGAGPGRRDGLVAALAAGAERCVRAPDGLARPGAGSGRGCSGRY